MAYVDQIENPPVNPLTFQGRGSSVVAREVATQQDSVRDAAVSNAAAPPVFQSDYVFISMNGGRDVALARCCNCPFGGATRAEDMIDVTEYEHTPQVGLPPDALLGTFAPKLNPNYDPKKRGSKQYIRHYDVKLSNILVFNVKTSGKAAGGLHVRTESLQALQQACPRYALPQVMPRRHANMDGSRHHRQPAHVHTAGRAPTPAPAGGAASSAMPSGGVALRSGPTIQAPAPERSKAPA